jgi:hypothetical protein
MSDHCEIFMSVAAQFVACRHMRSHTDGYEVSSWERNERLRCACKSFVWRVISQDQLLTILADCRFIHTPCTRYPELEQRVF